MKYLETGMQSVPMLASMNISPGLWLTLTMIIMKDMVEEILQAMKLTALCSLLN
ncbi:MAG: hypothetical protein KCCBMMGE_02324 [Candidatus Methanoperedenaceae archaeon GB37]|nr:MAG: hypothetical protein KCCBMMGE_02324 [Candidatus Methanoperedenaceae archaeon GB37]